MECLTTRSSSPRFHSLPRPDPAPLLRTGGSRGRGRAADPRGEREDGSLGDQLFALPVSAAGGDPLLRARRFSHPAQLSVPLEESKLPDLRCLSCEPQAAQAEANSESAPRAAITRPPHLDPARRGPAAGARHRFPRLSSVDDREDGGHPVSRAAFFQRVFSRCGTSSY